MQSFDQLAVLFEEKFRGEEFAGQPDTLYEPNRYFLKLGGKRLRPILCLMAHELFSDLNNDSWNAAVALELFHNFTLIHDDIMDEAPLRRGMETVHRKYGNSTALLAGDVMLVKAYEYLARISPKYIYRIFGFFNRTAREVCEGQQLDMDYERKQDVAMDDYMHMINLKTSVLLAASLQIGATLGGAGERNQNLIYEFGRKLGLAFQVQDDYLDAFGDPGKFGKQVGGDIKANKKTFLLIHALQDPGCQQQLKELMAGGDPGQVEKVLAIYRSCGADEWALRLKENFLNEALDHLEDVAVLSARKQNLRELALSLITREK